MKLEQETKLLESALQNVSLFKLLGHLLLCNLSSSCIHKTDMEVTSGPVVL